VLDAVSTIKNTYHSKQSSWISTTCKSIVDLYAINAHSSATGHLAVVNALLENYTLNYQDSDRKLLPGVKATIPILSSFALKQSNAIPRYV